MSALRTRRVWAGVGLAFAGHLATVLLSTAIALSGTALDQWWTVFALGLQFVLFVACLVAGIVLIRRGDRSLGTGLLTGWGVGLVLLCGLGSGAALYVYSQITSVPG